jgi:hypothetical protein
MKEQPMYKSLKVTFETWQALTRLAAMTGEPRTRLIERLAREEEERLRAQKDKGNG